MPLMLNVAFSLHARLLLVNRYKCQKILINSIFGIESIHSDDGEHAHGGLYYRCSISPPSLRLANSIRNDAMPWALHVSPSVVDGLSDPWRSHQQQLRETPGNSQRDANYARLPLLSLYTCTLYTVNIGLAVWPHAAISVWRVARREVLLVFFSLLRQDGTSQRRSIDLCGRHPWTMSATPLTQGVFHNNLRVTLLRNCMNPADYIWDSAELAEADSCWQAAATEVRINPNIDIQYIPLYACRMVVTIQQSHTWHHSDPAKDRVAIIESQWWILEWNRC